MVFYKIQLSNPEFWTFSQLFIARSMGFKTQVFNLQVLTQTEFENPQRSYFRPKKDQFLVYFNMASKLLMSVVWFKLVYGPFKKSNTHYRTHDFCHNRPVRNQMYES